MKKRLTIFTVMMLIVFSISAVLNTTLATSTVNANETCDDGWWGCAYEFFKTGRQAGSIFEIEELENLKSMVFYIGNIMFILITSILGVKYIWGSVDAKASVKNGLFTLMVAALVFYGWNSIVSLLDIQGLLTGSSAAGGYEGIAQQIYSIVLYIVNFLAIGGIIFIGVKYLMAGADGKSEVKTKLMPLMLGIVMVYGTIHVINFVLEIAGVI